MSAASTVRVAAIADLHGHLPAIPPCDVLLVAGDVCPVSDHRLEFQRAWLEGPFAGWLEGVEAGAVVGIAGNHDFLAESEPDAMRRLPWTYLADETVVVDGLTIHGSPWVPTFRDWAFMRDDAELASVWERVPGDADVLMTHGPPYGHGDLVVDGRHAGSETLLRRLGELDRLRLHVFGHIHEAGGSLGRVNGASVANVSHVDFHYRPVRPAAVFEL
jgi:Icc-related predicted phosphoesterase